ncbi:TraV family lipoprotein [Cupriavidus sp. YAF13]|uniref:TraV family lipoprotein n=1 Tax=Cupriavidus sp. YAF13 TaxID=3233075 RepID=UPI003F8E0981
MRRTLPGLCAAAMLAAGCADMSGLNAESHFACAAPQGSSCLSVSGVYANLQAGNVPGAGTKTGMPTSSGLQGEDLRMASPAAMAAPYSGPPARSPERTLRVWVAPYEDDSGTLFDQKYFYVLVSRGQWLIEKNRENLLRSRFRTVYPLQAPNTSEPAEAQPPTTGATPFMPPMGQGSPMPQSPVPMVGE